MSDQRSDDDGDAATVRAFHEVVNMTAAKIEHWLDSADSKEVGFKEGEGGESVGHRSGRHIIKILGKKKTDLDADDLAHMKKVVGYLHRHLAQRPHGDVSETRWRYSLMNWGHDPAR